MKIVLRYPATVFSVFLLFFVHGVPLAMAKFLDYKYLWLPLGTWVLFYFLFSLRQHPFDNIKNENLAVRNWIFKVSDDLATIICSILIDPPLDSLLQSHFGCDIPLVISVTTSILINRISKAGAKKMMEGRSDNNPEHI